MAPVVLVVRLVVFLPARWGRPHRVGEDPTAGWRGSPAGPETLSRRRGAPGQPVFPGQEVESRKRCLDVSTASGGAGLKAAEFGCCEASWPTGATSKVRETLLRDLPSPSLTPLRPTTPLGLVSRDCQDHKGAGDPRQEDIGGAERDRLTKLLSAATTKRVPDADISRGSGS